MTLEKKAGPKIYIFLYLNFLIYSFSTICMKFASAHPLFSLRAAVFFFLAFLCMFVYALVWQQLLKHLPLSVAYGSRGILIVYAMIFGFVVFNETIKINMLIGSGIVIAGVLLIGKSDE